MIGRPTITKFLPKVLSSIIRHLKAFGTVPSTTEEWLSIEERFRKRWDHPHVLGAIDGKHILMMKPHNSGAVYFNYKKTFSISLLAIVSGDYMFRYYDIGRPGRMSDAGIWNMTAFRQQLESPRNPLNIPQPAVLMDKDDNREPNGVDVPYYLVGDDAFGLGTHMMKPYVPCRENSLTESQTIFNYRYLFLLLTSQNL